MSEPTSDATQAATEAGDWLASFDQEHGLRHADAGAGSVPPLAGRVDAGERQDHEATFGGTGWPPPDVPGLGGGLGGWAGADGADGP